MTDTPAPKRKRRMARDPQGELPAPQAAKTPAIAKTPSKLD